LDVWRRGLTQLKTAVKESTAAARPPVAEVERSVRVGLSADSSMRAPLRPSYCPR
jgi:hypothetical protein